MTYENIPDEHSLDYMEGVENQETKKYLTVEDILNDEEKLRILYQELIAQPVNYYRFINFGTSSERVYIPSVIFYISCHLGLSGAPQFVLNPFNITIEYLKLLIEKPHEAENFLSEKKMELSQIEGAKEDTCNFLRENLDLSKIIPDAPKQIMDQVQLFTESGKDFDFFTRDTEKVSGIEKFKDELQDSFSGKTVIELGAGSFPSGLQVAEDFGAENYIGVEIDSSSAFRLINQTVKRYNPSPTGSGRTLNNVKSVRIIPADMLSFLTRMPKGLSNVTIIISGIDEFIFKTAGFRDTEERKVGEEYLMNTVSSISQVLGPGCRIVCYETNFNFRRVPGFKKIKSLSDGADYVDVYEKI